MLVQPDYRQENFGFRLAAMTEPLALEMVAAALDGHDVRIVDLRCGDDLAAEVNAFAPHLVGVTALTTEVYVARDVLRTVKRIDPEIFTVVGGHHASLLPEDFFLPQVDAVAVGEGEVLMAELAACLAAGGELAAVAGLIWRDAEGRFRANPRREALIDLDACPLPRRDLVERHRGEYFFLFHRPDSGMATGRGCPYRCNFCSVWQFYGGRTRMMCPERVLRELRTIRTGHVTLVDDNFLLNHRREDEIADRIRAEGIAKRYSMECRCDAVVRHPELVTKWAGIGLHGVLLGLEGSDQTLAAVNKNSTVEVNDQAIAILQQHGLVIWGAFLVDPDWEADDFKRLAEFVHARGITHTQYTVLTPLPGTQLYHRRRADLITDDYSCFDALHAVVPTRLPREEFYRRFADLYRQTDTGPYIEMLRNGKLSVENLKAGKDVLDAMSNWENYARNDPILRARRKSAYQSAAK